MRRKILTSEVCPTEIILIGWFACYSGTWNMLLEHLGKGSLLFWLNNTFIYILQITPMHMVHLAFEMLRLTTYGLWKNLCFRTTNFVCRLWWLICWSSVGLESTLNKKKLFGPDYLRKMHGANVHLLKIFCYVNFVWHSNCNFNTIETFVMCPSLPHAISPKKAIFIFGSNSHKLLEKLKFSYIIDLNHLSLAILAVISYQSSIMLQFC